MGKQYPRIGRTDNHLKNTSAICHCGEVGKYKVHIEYTFMRGEDEVIWACQHHKKDTDYLVNALISKHKGE